MITDEVKAALDNYCLILSHVKKQRDYLTQYENDAWLDLLEILNKNSVIPQLNGAFRDCAYDEWGTMRYRVDRELECRTPAKWSKSKTALFASVVIFIVIYEYLH